VTGGRLRTLGPASVLTIGGYAVLGGVLLWSRFVGLGHSYASDELMTVTRYVSAGPREILAGAYIPNNHELFSLVGWATTEVLGTSAVGLRLWSAIPFVLGAIIVTGWLHIRVGRLSALLFLFFATLSPLLLDITRQARGYGLAFLAMSVVVVAALEAERSGRTAAIVALCAAGVVGSWTLPHFTIAFLATGAVLVATRELRRRMILGLTTSAVAIVGFYAPHLGDIANSSQQRYASPIETAWLVTAPVDQILIPALRDLDETLVHPGLASLFVAVGLALVIASSPLLRDRMTALLLLTGVVATIVMLWVTNTSVAPRFLSFLLVPLFILLATGTASILARFVSTRRPVVRTPIAVAMLAVFAIFGLGQLKNVVTLPREATREAASLIKKTVPPAAPVFAFVPYPRDLEFYLGRSVQPEAGDTSQEEVCGESVEVALVTQPWILEPPKLPCTDRAGVRHYRFKQYARGGRIDVWLIPPKRRDASQ
jgi:hypothetical protein